jgi:hypothetical protein
MLSHSLKLYRENVPSILLLSFTIVFPLLIFQALLTNYVYGLSSGLNDSILADFVNGFLTLLFLVVAQVPFIQFTLSDTNGSENPLKDTYRTFLYRGFSVYVFAFIYTAMVMAGMILFILPGMALLILLFLTPYIAVLNDLPSRTSWRIALRLGKKHFFKIAGLILLTSLLELLIEQFSLYGMMYVSTSYPVLLLSQMFLNVILFPLLVIVITNYVLEWKRKSWL